MKNEYKSRATATDLLISDLHEAEKKPYTQPTVIYLSQVEPRFTFIIVVVTIAIIIHSSRSDDNALQYLHLSTRKSLSLPLPLTLCLINTVHVDCSFFSAVNAIFLS